MTKQTSLVSHVVILIECIAELCDRWQITEFALFGSVLRDDFRPDSDIDVLVSFAPTAQRGLTETLQIRDELEALFGRPVDLLVKAAIDRLTISNFSQAII